MKTCMLIALVLLASCSKDTYMEGVDGPPVTTTPPASTPGAPANSTLYGVLRVKNTWTSNYLNIQNSQVACTATSFQWTFYKINNTQNFYIKDAVSGKFLSADFGGVLSLVSQVGTTAVWSTDLLGGTTYRIKNQGNNLYLNVETGPVRCSTVLAGWLSAQWVITQ